MPLPRRYVVHGLKVQVQFLIKFRRNVAVVRLEELVVIASKQPGHPLRKLEIVMTESVQGPSKAWQVSTPDGEFPALARSRGEKVPLGISLMVARADQPEAEVHPFPGEEHLP